MDRREFLHVSGAAWIGVLGTRAIEAQPPSRPGTVMTVLGPISPDALGSTLSHEHVLVDFIGADQVSRDRYDADEAYEVALPHLRARQGPGVPRVRRVHAGIPRARSPAARTSGEGHRTAHPHQHRILRRREGPVRSPTRVRGKRGPAGGPVGQGMVGWDRRNRDPAGVHQDRRGRRAAVHDRSETHPGGCPNSRPHGIDDRLAHGRHTCRAGADGGPREGEVSGRTPSSGFTPRATGSWSPVSRRPGRACGSRWTTSQRRPSRRSVEPGERPERARAPEPTSGLARCRLVQARRATGRQFPGVRDGLHRVRSRTATSPMDRRGDPSTPGVESGRGVHGAGPSRWWRG